MFSLANTDSLTFATGAKPGLREQVAALYEEARDDVYGYCLTFGLAPGEAQEAAQEVFLRLYETLRKGETIENPRAWVFRVAHNHSLKLRAKQRPQASGEFDWDAVAAPSGENPEAQAMDRQRTRRIQEAIASLSEQQRRCLLLRMEGLRYPEIAAALGISASSVGEFLRRAVTRLRQETSKV
jgi:RNA polymerase sigma-70 factor, ECF subfamily